MRYEWDEAKRLSNVEKHGIDFALVRAFEWDAAQVMSSRSSNEPRLVAIGPVGRRLHVLVFSIERRVVRVVSFRKANRREVIRYATQD
ncbi:BrnT family toxin [Gluconacetobacter liquefaciens]|nr:BrnT family toxin [Gluconacetobacter liquefaciens]MBB2184847.1 hypothetical protein [Gluconacetobacter liquefaciens]